MFAGVRLDVPVGVTPVNCSAADSRTNGSSGSFSVTVTDSAPTITVPGQQTVEASDAAGSNVNFVPRRRRPTRRKGRSFRSARAPRGRDFPIGTTTVTCTATDGGGASAAASFDVVVHDTTPPLVIPPLNAVVITDALLPSTDPRIAQFVAGAFAADLVRSGQL